MKEKVERFEDLVAWQKARALASRVYRLSLTGPISKDFTFCNQFRSAALSVPSNIAEGFERGGRGEFHQFLSIAKASCAELRNQLYIASDIEYIDADTTAVLMESAREVGRIIGGLRRAVAAQRSRPQSSVLSPQS
jgi:four helix bundle protein